MRQANLPFIGQKIRQTRRSKRLSQELLSQLSRVSRARIVALESEKITDITFGNLLNILHALDLDLRLVPLNRQRPTLEDLRAENEEMS
jgi:transcriptional regulator with XRE-family HTH domain